MFLDSKFQKFSLFQQIKPSIQYLHTVYVANNHRRKGIGEALVRRALKEAKKMGSNVSLGVNPLNDKAICLYKKLGFKFSKGQTIAMETN